MIAENQQIQICQSLDIDESLENIYEGNLEPQLSEGFQNLPIFERYLANEYQNYKKDDLILTSLCHIKNKSDLQIQRNAMITYFQKKSQNNCMEQVQRKLRGQISSQFITSLNSIPSYSIIYLTIFQLKDNRFNMVARNSRGECLAYFWKQRKCKKIQKIFKILTQMSKPVMAVIFDQTIQTQANIPEIQKIQQVANEFVYIFENVEHISVKIQGNTLRSEMTVEKGLNCILQFIDKQLVVCTPNLSALFQTQLIDFLTDRIKTIQQQDQSALSAIRGQVSEQQKNLSMDFIFVNVLRIWNCSPAQTIVIIQRLFMNQQQTFNKKQHFVRQKQIQREHNKNINSHFPDKMDESKPCKRCQIVNKKKSKKTSIRCQGCSVRFKKDIPLCPECFADFHQRIEYYEPRITLRKHQKLRALRIRNKKPIHFQSVEIQKQSQFKQESNSQVNNSSNKGNSFNNVPQPLVTAQMIQAAKKMDALLTQSFRLVNQLKQKGQHQTIQAFLGFYLNISLQKMQKISHKYPQLNQGLTKFGAQAQAHIKLSQYENQQFNQINSQQDKKTNKTPQNTHESPYKSKQHSKQIIKQQQQQQQHHQQNQ